MAIFVSQGRQSTIDWVVRQQKFIFSQFKIKLLAGLVSSEVFPLDL